MFLKVKNGSRSGRREGRGEDREEGEEEDGEEKNTTGMGRVHLQHQDQQQFFLQFFKEIRHAQSWT